MPPAKPPTPLRDSPPTPAIPLAVRTRQMLSDLAATARLVWAASPGLTSLMIFLSVVLALVPAATLWVGKLLLDEVALAVRGGLQGPENAYRQLAMLLGLQVAIGAAAVLLSTLYGASRELLGDTLQNRISLRILEKAASLDVERFENAETYDALRNAYGEVGTRPLGVMLQMVGIGQALVGENGAGKTTVVKLLTRLFEPSSGRILLNGMDAARFSPRSVQREMSIIFQDYGEYQMTARENIGLSCTDALRDDGAIEGAGQKSGAAEVVNTLPDRYETMLGRLFPGGHQLSGGQWQRLALGRLYFRSASVQVFDEPTAALDAAAEAATIERLRAHGTERITLLISHRFSTVRMADWIVVLHDGSVVESGSHEDLLATGGIYATLFNLQARGYREGPQPAFSGP